MIYYYYRTTTMMMMIYLSGLETLRVEALYKSLTFTFISVITTRCPILGSTQPSIPLGSVNEYQLRLGRQRQVWLIPIADERVGVQVKL